MLLLLAACVPHVPPTPPGSAAPAAIIAPDARPMVARMRAATGDPYGIDGLHFVFAVGDVRREYDWDVHHDRIAVRYTREDGVNCAVMTNVGYAGPVEEQREAWEMFVNDQFWLLAPAKVADPGATVTRTEAGVMVRYDGVGVTPGDTYSYDVDDSGVVRAWSYVLSSGKTGAWTWAPPTAVGPLHLSLERHSDKRSIRFEDVQVLPVSLGEPGVSCPLRTPLPAEEKGG